MSTAGLYRRFGEPRSIKLSICLRYAPVSSILALETSTEYCSVALLRDGRNFARSIHAGQSHSEHVLAMAREVLDEAGVGLSGCDAVGKGLRIACAVAQGLAYGADLPLLPISGLAAMAEELRIAHDDDLPDGALVLGALDARMGEVYWSLLEWRRSDDCGDSAWVELIPPALDRPADLALRLAAEGRGSASYGCGNAFRIFRPELAPLVGRIASVEVPHASAIARLAACVLDRARDRGVEARSMFPAEAAAPLYVRNRIALTTDERAARSSSANPARASDFRPAGAR